MSKTAFAKGNQLFRENKLEEAVEEYRLSINEKEEYFKYENLGFALLALGKKEEALTAFAKALLLNADSKISYQKIKKQKAKLPLSIIVPVYNTGKYLYQCIESILGQDFKDFELILINDGSTDNSLEIIKTFAQKDNRVILVNNDKPSGNPGTPRNLGIKIAKGEYLGFVDSDDWIDKDFFGTLIKKANEKSADIVFAGGFKNHIGNKVEERRYAEVSFDDSNSDLYKYHESFMIWDKIYRASIVKKLDIKLGETKAAVDVPFIFKSYYYLNNAEFCDKLLGYNYRRESESSVTVNFRKSSDCSFELDAYNAVYNWARECNVSSHYKSIIDFRQANSLLYTLKVINSSHFDSFYQKARDVLSEIDLEKVTNLAKKANKQHIVDKIKCINNNNKEKLVKLLKARAVTSNQKAPGKPIPIFNIEGKSDGILFFPDWSKTNPYQKLLYSAIAGTYDIRVSGYSQGYFKIERLRELRRSYKVIHLHWLHVFMDFSSENGADQFLKTLKYAKSIGYKIIYTAHNIISHDSLFKEQELKFRKEAAKYFDYVLAHGDYAKERLIKEIGVDQEKIYITPHSNYKGYYPNCISKVAARDKLGIKEEEFVFLFFGNIKAYKGVGELLESYQSVRRKYQKTKLIIAGRVFDEESEKHILGYCDNDSSIIFRPGYIDDQEVQVYFNASDITVLPYKNILTSGAALLSLSFDKPIIAPRTGLIPELIEDGKQGYMFDNYSQLTNILIECAKNHAAKEWGPIEKNFSFKGINKKLRSTEIAKLEPYVELFDSVNVKKQITSGDEKEYQYAIIRILGNDLPFRHEEGQTLTNLRFMLDNESEFEGAKKIWILNRIVDREKKKKIVDILNQYKKDYIDLEYDSKELVKIPFAYEELPVENYKLTKDFDGLDERTKGIVDTAIMRHKNRYLMNNNGARNRAIDEGRKIAKWVFPFDGNCFINDQAWQSIRDQLSERDDIKYHIVPMDRVLDNSHLLEENYQHNATEEPQIIFRYDSEFKFDENLVYGLKPKIDLIKKLGVPGIWENWRKLYPWQPHKFTFLPGAYMYSWTGWVARLFSGNKEQEQSLVGRCVNREKGIVELIRIEDQKKHFEKFNKNNLAYYSASNIEQLANAGENEKHPLHKTYLALKKNANEFLKSPLFSVCTKTTLPPSGNIKDYWHPSPYSWPNPDTPDGLPYIYKDGERVPGTRMYEKESIKYDRTSVQRLFDETTTLSLFGKVSGSKVHTKKAYDQIKNWFINPETSMNPHLTYSQVTMGKNNNMGTPSGLIETKDFYFFLDAVRIIRQSEFWTETDEKVMNQWCRDFLNWLNTSKQGMAECRTLNNHGVAFDLQTYAFAAYLGDLDQMYQIIIRSLSRLKSHVKEDGSQPHELKRTTTAHYTAFNLHLWLNLDRLLSNTSLINLANYEHHYKKSIKSPIKKAADWVLNYADTEWPYQQIDEFDKDRYQHIYYSLSKKTPFLVKKHKDKINKLSSSKELFFPHDGIAPYWKLALRI